jgi:hypothetical protein
MSKHRRPILKIIVTLGGIVKNKIIRKQGAGAGSLEVLASASRQTASQSNCFIEVRAPHLLQGV